MNKSKMIIEDSYEIFEEIGQGGMSRVYRGEDNKNRKIVAIKEVHFEKNKEILVQQVLAEANLLRSLNYIGLPKIYDIIQIDKDIYIIMEYIEGKSLKKIIEEEGRLSEEVVIKYGIKLCEILSYLHSRTPSIIYRDIKPANIMISNDGTLYLIDFGCAREFKEGALADTCCLGTVGYAAPEQFGNMGQTDPRTDIYGLGATLYHLLTGQDPCEPPHVLYPIKQLDSDFSVGIETIITKCLQMNPSDRYQTAADLEYAFEHINELENMYRKERKFEIIRDILNEIYKRFVKKSNDEKQNRMVNVADTPRVPNSAEYFAEIIFGIKKKHNRSIYEEVE